MPIYIQCKAPRRAYAEFLKTVPAQTKSGQRKAQVVKRGTQAQTTQTAESKEQQKYDTSK